MERTEKKIAGGSQQHVITTHLSGVVQPGVHGVAGGAQVRLSKLVLLGPAERGVAETLLDDCVEPGQQEVETGTLVWSLG